MKQWVSKLRAQKARLRLRQAEHESQEEAGRQWYRQVADPFLGFSAWLATLMLLYAGDQFPADVNAWFEFAGSGLLLLVGIVVSGLFLRLVNPELFRGNSKMLLLLVLLSLVALIPIRVLLYLETTTLIIPPSLALFLFPMALGPLLAAILISRTAGAILGLWIAYATAVYLDGNFFAMSQGLIATGIAVWMARDVRKRSRVFKIGLMIGIAQLVVVVARDALAPGMPVTSGHILRQVLASLISGTSTAVVVLLVLPLFEGAFGITTDITLLELSDLGHPLLQRLALEAPSTYHHCLMTANLAQSAAEEIDANPLLARICAYFHDIGKLTKPALFAENLQTGNNPHDDLSPSMSALLITAHVKEGMSFALLSKLPQPVVDVIQQHHGTSLISYFHRKARLQREQQEGARGANSANQIIESDFRYPGPRPQTREAGIIMLADSVEAASRSLAKPTPHHIRNLVQEIVQDKLIDGQLDECALTLADINHIRDSFVFTLTNVLHSRIPYPKNEARHPQSTGA